MPFTVTMPKLSPTMEEGQISKWHKKENDFVEAGDLLLEIATDKATIEHYALDEGWLRKILVLEEASAGINRPIAIFSVEKEESIEGYTPEGVEEPKKSEPKTMPIKEEERAPAAPQTTGLAQPAFMPEPPPKLKGAKGQHSSKRVVASPLAKKIAKEKNLDLSSVTGSGPAGRITEKDLAHAQEMGIVNFSKSESPEQEAGSFEEIPLSPMRKIIARRLQESKTFIPHFYVKKKIDAEAMMALRLQLKALNLKVTLNDLIIRASALALRKHPEINRGFNSVNQTIVQFKTVDVSVAVTLEEGLITPIIRQTDYKDLQEIGVEMRTLAQKAREHKLQEHEYKGGSFCISNLGMYAIDEFLAVINPPQVAILAVGGIMDEPVVKNGAVVPGKTLSLTLSCDHRVIDGAMAATFLNTLQQLLENPVSLTI